jgi:hypothetical protein
VTESPGSPSDPCLEFSLQAEASRIRLGDGKDLPFMRALLTLRSICRSEVTDLAIHVSLGQEGGTVQDVSHALAAASALPAGGLLQWDVYDTLLPAHPGTASKIHMFGHRAALNWIFDLAALAEYRLPGSSGPARTPRKRWTLRWSVADAATGAVALAIEAGKG